MSCMIFCYDMAFNLQRYAMQKLSNLQHLKHQIAPKLFPIKHVPSPEVNFSPKLLRMLASSAPGTVPVFPLSCARNAAMISCWHFSFCECMCMMSRKVAKSMRCSGNDRLPCTSAFGNSSHLSNPKCIIWETIRLSSNLNLSTIFLRLSAGSPKSTWSWVKSLRGHYDCRRSKKWVSNERQGTEILKLTGRSFGKIRYLYFQNCFRRICLHS